ncbi:MFS transporter [Primorskyibacter sp. S187A]|uniref:MFS transporter n=1 Tax=Primorskyibacter sp. S187A TaxID=3415130 RepID=UPI003C7DE56E
MTVTTPSQIAERPRLGAYSLFAGVLAAAGLPLYIHAPKFYVDSYGVSLAALGSVLFALRLLDVVQDPALGWASHKLRKWRRGLVSLGGIVLAASMYGLFAVAPPISPLWWFALMLTGVFSGFSLLTINFYAEGVAKAHALGGSGHLRLARWRETGALLGVCLAAIAPVLLINVSDAPFAAFAALFAGLVVLALVAMAREWTSQAPEGPPNGFATVLRDPQARKLLIIAFVNAAPVAVSSTLFLFFVESRLDAPGMEGALLLLFFVFAAITAPIWTGLAERFGTRPVLLFAMGLSILAFSFVFLLGSGDVMGFALICAASGAALGADMTLLPAAFAKRLETISPGGAEGFGLWAFVSKFTLAFAAVTLLPALEAAGFASGAQNTSSSLNALTFFYAGVPILLKLVAIGLLCATPLEED